MEQRVRTAIEQGRIEDEALLDGVRLEKVVSQASTKQAMIARVSTICCVS
jgi:ubiquitin carboxyl-terminal hydrolase 1